MKNTDAMRRHGGFTVVELAVVIAIIGILLGVVLTPLATRIRIQQFQDQERTLAEIKGALIGFAQAQGRLPCPDIGRFPPIVATADNVIDGLEDACVVDGTGSSVGGLPFATLGLGATDRWDRRYGYGVSANLTVAALTGQAAPNAGVDLTDRGTLVVNRRNPDKTLTTSILEVAAVVVSAGANGFGATNSTNYGATLSAPTGADELENVDADNTFMIRIRTDGAAGCDDTAAGASFCEFDDLVVFVPTPLLLGKMVQAGQLP